MAAALPSPKVEVEVASCDEKLAETIARSIRRELALLQRPDPDGDVALRTKACDDAERIVVIIRSADREHVIEVPADQAGTLLARSTALAVREGVRALLATEAEAEAAPARPDATTALLPRRPRVEMNTTARAAPSTRRRDGLDVDLVAGARLLPPFAAPEVGLGLSDASDGDWLKLRVGVSLVASTQRIDAGRLWLFGGLADVAAAYALMNPRHRFTVGPNLTVGIVGLRGESGPGVDGRGGATGLFAISVRAAYEHRVDERWWIGARATAGWTVVGPAATADGTTVLDTAGPTFGAALTVRHERTF